MGMAWARRRWRVTPTTRRPSFVTFLNLKLNHWSFFKSSMVFRSRYIKMMQLNRIHHGI
uniref:Uncharacterized protein n=1 Tax=Arundo donax TaxID=35708 RepID=A0A0A9G6T1_ARUDO